MLTIKARQLEIMIYLLKAKKTTYAELAKRFEVSSKTIERDINRLSSMGIPVYCTQGAGGGVQIDENYKFGTSFFTKGDIRQIIFALKITESLGKSPKDKTIINKLCLIAPELSAMFESDAENYLSIDLLSEKIEMNTEICGKIDYCLDNEVIAIINTTPNAACIGYVLKTDGVYLFYFANGYKTIKLNDIETFEVTSEEFERKFISYEEYKNTSTQT
ncbi:MAG: HTH domain-containing protein [Oscillospiraceae bacterium]